MTSFLFMNKDPKNLPNGSIINGVFHFKLPGDLSDPNNPYHSTKPGSAATAVTKGRPVTTRLSDFYDSSIVVSGQTSRSESPRDGVPNPMVARATQSQSQRQMEVEVPKVNNDYKNQANILLEDLDSDQLQKVIMSLGLSRFASQFSSYSGNLLTEVSSNEDLKELNIQMPAPFAKTLLNFIKDANRDGVDANFLI